METPSSFQSLDVCLKVRNVIPLRKSKPRNAWGQYKRVSGLGRCFRHEWHMLLSLLIAACCEARAEEGECSSSSDTDVSGGHGGWGAGGGCPGYPWRGWHRHSCQEERKGEPYMIYPKSALIWYTLDEERCWGSLWSNWLNGLEKPKGQLLSEAILEHLDSCCDEAPTTTPA